MRAAITGATGFLGGHLAAAALAGGWEVCAIVRGGSSRELPGTVAHVTDTGCASTLARDLATFAPDVVFHLAAHQSLDDSPASSDALIESNLAFGGRVLAAARASGARAFVSAGTFSAHATGTPGYVPQTLYAASKHAFTALAEHYRVNTPLNTVILELSDTYGPDDPRPKLVNLLLSSARTGEPVLASPGEQFMRPLHVSDAADAFMHAAHALLDGRDLGPAHSVAGSTEISLRGLASILEGVTGTTIPVEWGAQPYREREIMRPWAGNPLPGWKPRIDLADGLKTLVNSQPGA